MKLGFLEDAMEVFAEQSHEAHLAMQNEA